MSGAFDHERFEADRLARLEARRAESLAAVPTEYSEHARFVLHEIARKWGIPSRLLAEADLRSSLRPKVLRIQPAVRMALRCLPNPNGEPKL